MRRIVHSRYKVGDMLVLKKKYGKFYSGHKFLVIDPIKRGKKLVIEVEDPDTHERIYIPTKYMELYM